MSAIEEALALKAKGNKAIIDHDWLAAVEYYTQAIEKNDQDATFFCNRAQVSGKERLIAFRQISSLNHTDMQQ